MTRALRVLIVEDSEIDAALLVRELRRGYELTFERVQTEDTMREALRKQAWDVVISDYSMPGFSTPGRP
jgi:CheY-like chemotaxis protein